MEQLVNCRSTASTYRSNYLRKLCDQNRQLFNSPFIWLFHPHDLPLEPRSHFPGLRSVFLEVGFGHGEVLAELASKHPDVAFVGIERRPSRIRKALKRLERLNSRNVQLIRINLELLDRPLFARASFDKILINHPDPWPKRRHEHHRLFNPARLDWLDWILVPGGSVEVASDHSPYFFKILRLFEEDSRFDSLFPPPFYTTERIPDRPVSRFERKKRAAGQVVRILHFRRV